MHDKKRRRNIVIAIAAAFVAYCVFAVRPVPTETVLAPRWLASIEAGAATVLGEGGGESGAPHPPVPFALGGRHGYVDRDGRFLLNMETEGQVAMSPERWAQFGAEPGRLEIRGPAGDTVAVVEDPGGYPFFLDGRNFVIGREQSSISEIGMDGSTAWTFDFPGVVTVADAAAGLLLAGSLDGVATLVDGQGRQAFSFEPGGSRFPAILGAAISADGQRIAVLSGVDSQRFIVLERFGAGACGALDFRVVYHEFLGEGLRRPARVAFVEGGRYVAFEREGGLGIYSVASRSTRSVRIPGELRALDEGGQGMLFAVFARPDGSSPEAKELVGVRVAGRAPRVAMRAPFRSSGAALGRAGGRIVVGGDRALAAFDLERM